MEFALHMFRVGRNFRVGFTVEKTSEKTKVGSLFSIAGGTIRRYLEIDMTEINIDTDRLNL